jgi:hypothetical protein
MERIKRALGIGVFTTLFLSMFLSFMVSLSQNIHVLDVTASFCPMTQHDVFLFDEDEIEVANEYKILMEKNVLYTHPVPPFHEVINVEMEEPEKPHTHNLKKDIFNPPKARSV